MFHASTNERVRGVVTGVALAAMLAGCSAPSSDELPPPTGGGGGQRPTSDYPAISVTAGDIALRNLDAQIAGYATAMKQRPEDFMLARQYIGLLLSRMQFRSTFDDLTVVVTVAERMHQLYPDRSETQLLWAEALSSVHRFDEAEAIYQALPVSSASAQAKTMLHFATGRFTLEDVALVQARAKTTPTYASFTALALAQLSIGLYEDADRSFARAIDVYRDSSPFALAWVAFQRGLMWAESADQPARALVHYRQAVKWLPGYAVAEIHLAELERPTDRRAAVARLERVVAETQDPEATGQLGALLTQRGSVGDRALGGLLIDWASARYEALLARHPEAFWDHAAEHFAVRGKRPTYALALARINVRLRPTSRAYVIALKAAAAAGDGGAFLELVRGACRLRFRSATLDAVLGSAPAQRCGAQ